MAVLVLVPSLAAAATPEDPWEPANRAFYGVHRWLDRVIFGHAPSIFRFIPAPIRAAVRNVISNMGEPGVAANDLLQGHPGVSVKTLGRFTANTTLGLGGMIDVALNMGLPHHDNNFADTFGRWGAYPGPYVFVPLMGPTTVRDGLGSITDMLTDPFTWTRFAHRWTVIDARTVWSGVDQRTQADAQIQAIDNMSTDSYATLRSLYLQNRAQVIATPPGAEPTEGLPALPALPDFPDTGTSAPAPGASESAAPPPSPPSSAPADTGAAPAPSSAPNPAPAPQATPVSATPVSAAPEAETLSAHHAGEGPLASLASAAEPKL